MTTSPSDLRLNLDTETYRPGIYGFTLDELRAIYGLVEHQYIHYDNLAGHAVINRIMSIIRENELATRPGKSA